MPNPTYSQFHIDSALTNISVAYIQDEKNFIAAQVFPVIPVSKQSDRYFVYTKGDWFRDEAQERAAGTESAGGGYNLDNTPTYFCHKYAYHRDVTEDERTNSDDPLKPDEDATEFVTQKMLIRRELVWVNNYFGTGKWGTDWTGVASAPTANQVLQWNQAAAVPMSDIDNAKSLVQSTTGVKPNCLTIGTPVYYALRNCASILDRIKYTQRGVVTSDLLAALFDVDKLLVAGAVVNTANQGAADAISFIVGKAALLSYANPKPGIRQPSAGYSFAWTGLYGSGAFGSRIIRIPMPWLGQGTERIEAEMGFDLKMVGADLGLFMTTVVA